MSHILLQQVLEFHKKYKKNIGDPRTPGLTEVEFRTALIEEELQELYDALNQAGCDPKKQIIEVADALGDLAYVIFGAAVCWGIDLASVVDSIHESNMTKTVGEKRADGKVLKGPDYVPPKIEQALECAAYEASQDGFGDDSWWPKPTVSFIPEEDVDQEVTDKIMLAAKDQAKLLVMKSITGEMTSYGAYVFSCPCGRTHGVQARMGSRGGMAPNGKAECMCGKAFVVDFTGKEPVTTVTTIEELRKKDV